MVDWRIQKRREGCAECGRAFAEGEVLYSFLVLEPETFGREDRCTECFEARADAAGPDGAIFWRTRRPPEGKRRLAVDFDVVQQVFQALEARTEERLQELRYLLALLLLRKKRLKLVRVVREEGGEAMVLRRPRRTEALEVRVFDLPPERVRVLREEVARLFEASDPAELFPDPSSSEGSPDPPPPEGAESHEPSAPDAASTP